MTHKPTSNISDIKKQLTHPVIDADGHHIEFLPLVRDFLKEDAGADLADRFTALIHSSELVRQVPVTHRRALGLARTAWWGLPTRNTLDRATALLPRLLYDRLEELGIDYALLFPTYGLTVTAHSDNELRPAMARAFNRYSAEVFSQLRDKLEPVAAIPMATPEEALAELDFAVGELGLKAVMMAGIIPRPTPDATNDRASRYIDTVGHDSEYDYEPVWAKCEELGVAPTFHAGSQGLGMRASRTNYVYNHIGNFAAAGEATARSLFFAGVPARHPGLRFAFMEGGVAWGANLLADLLGHYEKRNKDAISHYDPAELDTQQLTELINKYGDASVKERLEQLPEALLMLSDPGEPETTRDEFQESLVSSTEEIVKIFTEQYFFGCEADDPMNAVGFASHMLPHNTVLKAVFASDIGHWDVPDMADVLVEATELLEDGHLSEEDFREFAFANAVKLWGGVNPNFFSDTSVEQEAAQILA